MSREDELMDQRHREVLDAIAGVNDRLDVLNSRTRYLENKVSVLSWAYTVAAAGCAYVWHRLSGQS